MSNDSLIDRLVSDLKPVRQRTLRRDALFLGAMCLLELALFLAMGMMRPDMPLAMHHMSFWWKFGSLGGIAAVGAGAALVSLDPVRSPRRGLRIVLWLVAVALAAGWAIDAIQGSVPALAARLKWHDGLHCVVKMVMLSLPAVGALSVLACRGAPTDRTGTALAAGIAAAAWGAFLFVFACPYDDPLYIAVWSSVACSIVVLCARFVMPLLTRW